VKNFSHARADEPDLQPIGKSLPAVLRQLAAAMPPESQLAAIRYRSLADFLEAGGIDQEEELAA
jgi:hypothetical protein